jgi:hypothetical protein
MMRLFKNTCEDVIAQFQRGFVVPLSDGRQMLFKGVLRTPTDQPTEVLIGKEGAENVIVSPTEEK